MIKGAFVCIDINVEIKSFYAQLITTASMRKNILEGMFIWWRHSLICASTTLSYSLPFGSVDVSNCWVAPARYFISLHSPRKLLKAVYCPKITFFLILWPESLSTSRGIFKSCLWRACLCPRAPPIVAAGMNHNGALKKLCRCGDWSVPYPFNTATNLRCPKRIVSTTQIKSSLPSI